MDFNWEALVGFIVLGTIFLGGVWRVSSQLRGIEDKLLAIPELMTAKNDHETRLTKIETVCNIRHGRVRPAEALEA